MKQTCTLSTSQTKLKVHQSHLMPYVKELLVPERNPPLCTEVNFLAGLHWLLACEKLPKLRGYSPVFIVPNSLCDSTESISSLCCGRETHLSDLVWVHSKETTPAINLTDTLAEQPTQFGDQNVASAFPFFF